MSGAVISEMTSTTVAVTKRSLLVLSHAMERAFAVPVTGDAPECGLILALFQRREYFDIEAHRYAALAAAGDTVIVGFTGSTAGMPAGVHAVRFEPGEEPATDWVLVMCRAGYGTSLIAQDLKDLSPAEVTLESGRLFRARWTFRRATAITDARHQLDRIADRLPATVASFCLEQLSRFAALPVSAPEAQLAAAADHLVHSLEASQRKLMRLRTALDATKSLAERDQLTGLYNRHFLERFLGAEDRPAELTVMLVDVDNLKTTNDTHGHDAGDAVLSAVARTLKDHTRPGDVVIRWGGDEFLLLVPHLTPVQATPYAQRVLDAIRARHPAAPWNELTMSVSIGISAAHRSPLPLNQLDEALYQAKRAGRGRVVVAPDGNA